jgi:hypothetical protein
MEIVLTSGMMCAVVVPLQAACPCVHLCATGADLACPVLLQRRHLSMQVGESQEDWVDIFKSVPLSLSGSPGKCMSLKKERRQGGVWDEASVTHGVGKAHSSCLLP